MKILFLTLLLAIPSMAAQSKVKTVAQKKPAYKSKVFPKPKDFKLPPKKQNVDKCFRIVKRKMVIFPCGK